MKQKFLIFLSLIFLIFALIGLNAASYVQQEKVPDTEFNPNRSTYNAGATGTRAFYDLLAETGRNVTRWQEPPSALLSKGKNAPDTFVIVGEVKREFEDNEIRQLFEWVSAGGKLVIIDRVPNKDLIATTANWNVSVTLGEQPSFNADPSNQNLMVGGITAAKPVQPGVYTVNVNAVQPSRFASSINFDRFFDGANSQKQIPTQPPPMPDREDDWDNAPLESVALTAPVVHLANKKKTLLVDFPFGAGKIVFLSDPFIVTNSGIALADNAQLAVNIVSSSASEKNLVAFDEYHQGYGSNNNQLFAYFSGTPVFAIFLQFLVLIGLIFYSQSRRFARALPEKEPNRLSKLEYIAAMAELQRRARGYDLAIENIYTDFRRRAARSLGVDNYAATREELAKMIADRAKLDRKETEDLMFKCEEIIYGEKTNKKEVLKIVARLREIEEKLNLKRQKPARK